MKDKLIMVVGVGSSKFLQILFSLYLSYQFSHGALATFVLIMTLSVATSSIVSLGVSPQIMRAGAYEDPNEYIITTISTAIILLGIVLTMLFIYIFLGGHKLYIQDYTKLEYFISTAFVSVSFIIYSIIHSYLSHKQKYLVLGFSSIIIYSIPFVSSVFLGSIGYDVKYIVLNYCFNFFVVSVFVYIKVVSDEIKIKAIITNLKKTKNFRHKIFNFITAAAFGFITMVSLYFAVRFVNNTFEEQQAAMYSVSFQFFQIGVFLPSVLGAVFIPKLVKNKNDKTDSRLMKKSYLTISLVWIILCAISLYPIFVIYKFPFDKELLLTFLIMQLTVILSALQALYNQKYVAAAQFKFLAFNAMVWAFTLLFVQFFSPSIVYYSSLALLLAYFSSLCVFWLNERLNRA